MSAATLPAASQRGAAGSSFYAGMRVLPRERRHAMYAVYAFCRAVDDIADDHGGDRAERARALDRWRRDIDALYDGGDAGEAAFLAGHVARFALPREDFHAVIDGMAMDVARDIRWPAAAELALYCGRVACAVGRLSTAIFGMTGEPAAALADHLGRALQLTNILRDIDEDAAVGRVYLPKEALIAAGIALTTPIEVAGDLRLDAAARAIAAQAERHFAAARAVLRARPSGHLLAPRLMEAAYARLLARLTARGWAPPRRPVRLSRIGLLWTVFLLRFARR